MQGAPVDTKSHSQPSPQCSGSPHQGERLEGQVRVFTQRGEGGEEEEGLPSQVDRIWEGTEWCDCPARYGGVNTKCRQWEVKLGQLNT